MKSSHLLRAFCCCCLALSIETASLTVDEAGESAYGCFVDRQYLDFLGRIGEDGGYNFYIDRLSSGAMSPQEVTRNFILSPEVNGNRGFINRCYFGLFNNNSLVDYATPGYRYADYGGLMFWSGEGVGNISLDPMLVDAENGDFHLLPNSPCIDTGKNVN